MHRVEEADPDKGWGEAGSRTARRPGPVGDRPWVKERGAGKQGPVSKQETYVLEAEAQHTFRKKQTEVRSEKDVETS